MNDDPKIEGPEDQPVPHYEKLDFSDSDFAFSISSDFVPASQDGGAIVASAERQLVEELKLENSNYAYQGRELLAFIEEVLPEGVYLSDPRILGHSDRTVSVSFNLIDGDYLTYFIPDTSYFEFAPDCNDDMQDSFLNQDGPSLEFAAEFKKDGKGGFQRVPQRVLQTKRRKSYLAEMNVTDGNAEEIFEPVRSPARIILTETPKGMKLGVVLSDISVVPHEMLSRFVSTFPKEDCQSLFEIVFPSKEIESSHSIVEGGLSEEEMIASLKMGSKQAAELPRPKLSAPNLPDVKVKKTLTDEDIELLRYEHGSLLEAAFADPIADAISAEEVEREKQEINGAKMRTANRLELSQGAYNLELARYTIETEDCPVYSYAKLVLDGWARETLREFGVFIDAREHPNFRYIERDAETNKFSVALNLPPDSNDPQQKNRVGIFSLTCELDSIHDLTFKSSSSQLFSEFDYATERMRIFSEKKK